MFYGARGALFERAKKLRATETKAEQLLWERIKDKQLGVKFRRQHPIKEYVVDFYCHECKLVIELDGSVHEELQVQIKDVFRQEDIEALAIEVIRFTNNQVYNAIELVVQKIRQCVQRLKPL